MSDEFKYIVSDNQLYKMCELNKRIRMRCLVSDWAMLECCNTIFKMSAEQ